MYHFKTPNCLFVSFDCLFVGNLI